MAGGTWIKQNKVRAGAYINFKGKYDETVASERGIVGLPIVLPFGPEKEIIEIDNNTDLFEVLGIQEEEACLLMLREALKKANKVLLYRINGGVKAACTSGDFVITSKFSGTVGNDIRVVIQSNIDDAGYFDVITFLGDIKVEAQKVKTAADLVSNSFVDFSGKGDLTVSAGLKLAGGENKTATGEDYADFLKELELHEFNVIAMPVSDSAIKAVTKEFVRRLREEDGRKIQAVLPDYKEADYEGIISVKNGVYIKNNVHVSNVEATSYIAALTASAGYAVSNTYAEYEGAINVDCKYSDREIITAIQDGEIVFIKNGEKILVEQDINTLKTFSDGKKSDFRKNRVIRVLDGINNRIKTRWEEVYIGKTSNNEDGRNLFKKDVLKILETLESEGALENVTIDDIDVAIGASKDSVLVKVNAQPVDAMEKIYMTVYV